MNTDNKTPEEAMDKPVAASTPNAGESPAPAAQSSAAAESATATEKAAQKQDDSGAAKPQAQSASDNNKESAAQNANAEVAKDAKDKAEDAKAAKRGGGPRRVSGIVIGNKADKTARVRIERRVKHALYGKVIRRRTHLQAHDADNKCRIGDKVMLEESPRFSKTKSWRVVAITPGEGR